MSSDVMKQVAGFLVEHGEASSEQDRAKVRVRHLVALVKCGPVGVEEGPKIRDLENWTRKRTEYLSVESTALILLNGGISEAIAGLSLDSRISEYRRLMVDKIMKAIHHQLIPIYVNSDTRLVASSIQLHMPLFDVYDSSLHRLGARQLSDAVAAIRPLVPKATSPKHIEALVKIYLYLMIWHDDAPDTARMTKAVDELKDFGIPMEVDEMKFGPTTEVGSDLWDDSATCQYWDGDKYATPYGAAKDRAIVCSQAQGAGMFSRDAMDDAKAIARLFGGNLAVSASE